MLIIPIRTAMDGLDRMNKSHKSQKSQRRALDADDVDYKTSGLPVPLSDKPQITKMTDNSLTLLWLPSVPEQPRFPVSYVIEFCKPGDGVWTVYQTGKRLICITVYFLIMHLYLVIRHQRHEMWSHQSGAFPRLQLSSAGGKQVRCERSFTFGHCLPFQSTSQGGAQRVQTRRFRYKAHSKRKDRFVFTVNYDQRPIVFLLQPKLPNFCVKKNPSRTAFVVNQLRWNSGSMAIPIPTSLGCLAIKKCVDINASVTSNWFNLDRAQWQVQLSTRSWRTYMLIHQQDEFVRCRLLHVYRHQWARRREKDYQVAQCWYVCPEHAKPIPCSPPIDSLQNHPFSPNASRRPPSLLATIFVLSAQSKAFQNQLLSGLKIFSLCTIPVALRWCGKAPIMLLWSLVMP